MFTHEFWVNICAHTSSGASAPTQVLLIEWQSHYAKRLAPWDFLTNMHTRLVFLLRFFISLLLSLSFSNTLGFIPNQLHHSLPQPHYTQMSSVSLAHTHAHNLQMFSITATLCPNKNANNRTRFHSLVCSLMWQE